MEIYLVLFILFLLVIFIEDLYIFKRWISDNPIGWKDFLLLLIAPITIIIIFQK